MAICINIESLEQTNDKLQQEIKELKLQLNIAKEEVILLRRLLNLEPKKE